MTIRAWILLVAMGCAVTCSSPPQPYHHAVESPKDPVEDRYVLASSDRAKPQPIPIDARNDRYDIAYSWSRAPMPGIWWYAVDLPSVSDKLSTLSFTVSGSKDVVAFVVVEDAREHVATTKDEILLVTIPELPEPPPRLLLRVTTRAPAKFVVSVTRQYGDLPPVKPPPCDRDHIDPNNPNCAGVYPPCNLNDPDFTNPSCCEAAGCSLGRLSCRAKVVSGGPSGARIAIGANMKIMRFATGWLLQQRERVSDVLVLQVDDHESFIRILSPKKVDMATLSTNSEVVLYPPEACMRR